LENLIYGFLFEISHVCNAAAAVAKHSTEETVEKYEQLEKSFILLIAEIKKKMKPES
jgi:hypothetical protein